MSEDLLTVKSMCYQLEAYYNVHRTEKHNKVGNLRQNELNLNKITKNFFICAILLYFPAGHAYSLRMFLQIVRSNQQHVEKLW